MLARRPLTAIVKTHAQMIVLRRDLLSNQEIGFKKITHKLIYFKFTFSLGI